MKRIQLLDRYGNYSPVLDFHCDEEEFIAQVELWLRSLLHWQSVNEDCHGQPLGRLEVEVCMVDLMRHITAYEVKAMSASRHIGRIIGTIRLYQCMGRDPDSTVYELKPLK